MKPRFPVEGWIVVPDSRESWWGIDNGYKTFGKVFEDEGLATREAYLLRSRGVRCDVMLCHVVLGSVPESRPARFVL